MRLLAVYLALYLALYRLLAALKLLDEALEQQEGTAAAQGAAAAQGVEGGGGALRVVAVITGKGPLKAKPTRRL